MSFTNNIKNTTYEISGTTLIIKPNTGYVLPSSIRQFAVYCTDTPNTYIRCSETIVTGANSWTFTIDSSKNYTSDYLFAYKKSDINTFFYETDSLINCDCNIQSGTAISDLTSDIIFTPKNGMYFNDIALTDTRTTLSFIVYGFTRDNDYRQNNLNLLATKNGNDVTQLYVQKSAIDSALASYPTMCGITIGRQIKADLTDEYATIKITGSFTNCSANVSNNDKVTTNDKIIITAFKGCEFLDNNYSITLYDNAGILENNIDGIKADDNATITFNLNDYFFDLSEIRINANSFTAIGESPKSLLSNLVRIYQPTNDEINSLAKEVTAYNWFLGMYYLPFNIPKDYLSETKKPIVIEKDTAQTTATEYLYWTVTIQGGSVTIPYKYNNVYDYINTDCYIHIPFFGDSNINIEQIINQKLTLTYYVNLYMGIVTACITNGDNFPIIETTKNIAYYLPLSGVNTSSFFYYQPITTQLSVPMLENNRELSVKIIRKVPYPDNGFMGKNNIFYSKLKDLTGWQVVDDIQLDNNIPDPIQTEIRSILESGCIV